MENGVGQARLFPSRRGNLVSQQSDPTTLLHLVLADGPTAPTATRPSPRSMPSFAWKLDDRQIADVASFVRNSWGNRAAPVTARQAARLRQSLRLEAEHLTDNSTDR